MRIEIGQIITQIISFLIMLWVLKRFAWKPLLGLLDERQSKIKNEFASIDRHHQQIERLKEEYNKHLKDIEFRAKEAMLKAVDEGQKVAHTIQKNAHEEAKAILIAAKDNVQREIDKAKVQLKDELVKISMLATEQILKSIVDEKKQKEMILDFIDQASQMPKLKD